MGRSDFYLATGWAFYSRWNGSAFPFLVPCELYSLCRFFLPRLPSGKGMEKAHRDGTPYLYFDTQRVVHGDSNLETLSRCRKGGTIPPPTLKLYFLFRYSLSPDHRRDPGLPA